MQDTQESQFQSLGREGALEKEMATYSSILAWEIPWTEEAGRLQSMGSQRVGQDLAAEHTQAHTHNVQSPFQSLRHFLPNGLGKYKGQALEKETRPVWP